MPRPRKKKSYGQFCPVAKASEVVAERWTPLILREFLCGSTRFGELRKGVPLMSPTLLSQRLKELEAARVIERRGAGRNTSYHLTEAGRDLQPVVEMLGLWGHRWARRQLRKEDLDPAFLMWDVRRGIRADEVGEENRLVVRFDLGGVPIKKRRWWLVIHRGEVDLCLIPPGVDDDLAVSAHIKDLVRVWLGDEPVRKALAAGRIELDGPRRLTRAFPKWFGPSRFAMLQAQ